MQFFIFYYFKSKHAIKKTVRYLQYIISFYIYIYWIYIFLVMSSSKKITGKKLWVFLILSLICIQKITSNWNVIWPLDIVVDIGGPEIKKAKNHWKQWHICKKIIYFDESIFFLLIKNHQFWSPLFMTEEARHSFSLIDHGSVGPNINLCSVQRIKRQNIKRRMHFKCKRHSSTSGCVALRDALYKSGWAVWQLITGHI